MPDRVAQLEAETAALQAQLREAQLENKLLREKVDALIRALYGRKSEALDANQLLLLGETEAKKDEAPAADEPPEGAVRKAQRPSAPKRPRLPEHLPVKEIIVDPEEVTAQPEAWRLMGQEVSEQLDYEPARFWRRRLIRRKYVRLDTPFEPPILAPLPPTLQERCLATPELIAQVIVSKYVDHQPLYRQEQIYRRRHGVDLPRQTLCRWMELAARWCTLLYNELRRQQMASPYLQVDETPIPYLNPGRGQTAQGYLWVSHVPHGDVVYHWHPGRSANCLHKIIAPDFQGTLQTDGYQAYTAFQKQRDGPAFDRSQQPVQLASCWAHARRKFYQARDRDPRLAGWILRQIGHLYRIERELRARSAGPTLRQAVRAAQSALIVARLHRALMILQQRYLPKSALGQAIRYALGQWSGLEKYLQNGLLEIDNNLVENAIRPTKLGAKNWLFVGSEDSGQTTAILYTLVESAKRHGLEPYGYLLHLLRELPTATNQQIARYTPAAVARAKRLKTPQAVA